MLNMSVPAMSHTLGGDPRVDQRLYVGTRGLTGRVGCRPGPFTVDLQGGAPHAVKMVMPSVIARFFTSVLDNVRSATVTGNCFIVVAASRRSCSRRGEGVRGLIGVRIRNVVNYLSRRAASCTR